MYHEVQLPIAITGERLLAAARIASTEGRYHSTGQPSALFAGQYNRDAYRSILVSAAPNLCEESGIDPHKRYERIYLGHYMWSLPYDIFDGRNLNKEPLERFADRLLKALG